MRRRVHKIDANQPEFVALWKSLGATVINTASAGDGVSDVWVGFRGRWVPVEIKNPDGRGKKLTPAQILLHGEIQRAGLPIAVVTNRTEALALLGAREAA